MGMSDHKLLFLEANTTGTGMIALRVARSLGVTPVFLTNNASRYAGLEQCECEVVVADTNSIAAIQQVIEGIGPSAICGIVSTSEFYLPTVAEIAQRYGFPGNSSWAMLTCRNKAMMRRALQDAGVSQPRFVVVHAESEVAAAVATVGLPCIVKPVDDTGSNNVLLCETEEQARVQAALILSTLKNARGQETARTVLIEEFLHAPEYSVEMFTWRGKTTCVGITQKSLIGFPYFVESRHIFPAPLPPEIAQCIERTVQMALDAVGITVGATHTEVKWTNTGCAIVEINARLAGGMIPELIRLVTGEDMLVQQLKVMMGSTPTLNLNPSGYAGIQFVTAPRNGILESIRGAEAVQSLPGVEQVVISGREGTPVNTPRSAYDRLGFIIVRCETAELTASLLASSLQRIEVSVRPQEL